MSIDHWSNALVQWLNVKCHFCRSVPPPELLWSFLIGQVKCPIWYIQLLLIKRKFHRTKILPILMWGVKLFDYWRGISWCILITSSAHSGHNAVNPTHFYMRCKFTMHTAYFTLHYTLFTLNCILNSSHYILHTTYYILQTALYILHTELHTNFFTLHTSGHCKQCCDSKTLFHDYEM